MPLSAFAGDFKVHCSPFTMGLQIESENNTMVACMQTNESSRGSWTEMRPKQLPSLTDIFIIAAPLRQLLMCISLTVLCQKLLLLNFN